jgi:hypothetical protein
MRKGQLVVCQLSTPCSAHKPTAVHVPAPAACLIKRGATAPRQLGSDQLTNGCSPAGSYRVVIYRKVKGWKTKGWDSKVLLTVHAHMNKHAVISPPQLCCRHRSPRLSPSVNNNTTTHLCLPPQLPGTAVSAAAADRQSLAFQPAAPPASPLQCLACHR